MAHARPHPPEEDHLRRNVRSWRARPLGLLLGLEVQPIGRQRRQMAWMTSRNLVQREPRNAT
jgi:hypothetical protein